MDKSAITKDLMQNGFSCAPSLFAAFAEDYSMDKELALKIATALGGGMGCGELCGAISGATLVIGLKNGHYLQGDMEAKALCTKETADFIRQFREQCGSCLCRDLLGVDLAVEGAREEAKRRNLFGTVCIDFVAVAADILEDMGY